MTKAAKATHRPKKTNISDAKYAVRVRRYLEDSMVGASQAERRYLRRGIVGLDRIISLLIEFDAAVESLRKLAIWKPRRRVAASTRGRR
jgi:hypothetical protein